MADFLAGLDSARAAAIAGGLATLAAVLWKGLLIFTRAIVGHFEEYGRLRAQETSLTLRVRELEADLEESRRETSQQRRAKLRAKRRHVEDLRELRRRGHVPSSIPPVTNTTRLRE